MPAPLVLLVAVAGCAVAMRAPLRWALGATLAGWLLIPGTLLVPYRFSSYARIPSVILVFFALGMIIRARKGEVRVDAFRPGRMHALVAIYLIVAVLNGVVLSSAEVPAPLSLHIFTFVLDEALFFVFVTAAVRTLGVVPVARLVAGIAVVAGVIAIGEHLTGSGYSHFLFEHLPQLATDPGALPLARRGSGVRAEVAAQFALEFGWVAALVLPLVVAVALTARRRWIIVAPIAVLGGVVSSYSRSAVAGIMLAGVVMLLAARGQRRIVVTVVVTAAIAFGIAFAVPAVRRPFHAAGTNDSNRVRVERIQSELAAAVHRPLIGIGLGGLVVHGLPGTDVGYILSYAETGAIGIVALLAVVLAAIGFGVRAVRAPPDDSRVIAVGVLAGLVLVPLAIGSYDFPANVQSMRTFLLLAALAVVIGERGAGALARPRLGPARLALPAMGLAVGVLVLLAAPRHTAETWRFSAVSLRRAAEESRPESFPSDILVGTVCHLARTVHLHHPDVRSDCRTPLEAPRSGIGDLRLEGPNATALQTVAGEVFGLASPHVQGLVVTTLGPPASGRPAGARTAPVTLSLAGLLLAAFWPGRRQPVEPAATARPRRAMASA